MDSPNDPRFPICVVSMIILVIEKSLVSLLSFSPSLSHINVIIIVIMVRVRDCEHWRLDRMVGRKISQILNFSTCVYACVRRTCVCCHLCIVLCRPIHSDQRCISFHHFRRIISALTHMLIQHITQYIVVVVGAAGGGSDGGDRR